MILKSEAIVLKGFKYGESSKIVTIFTREAGKFPVIVKATRSLKSKYSGVIENINLVLLILNKKENRELQVLTNAEIINSYAELKSDLKKLSIAFRIVELLDHTLHIYDKHEDIFDLSREILNALNSADKNYENYLLVFQLRLSEMLGFSPGLDNKVENDASDETIYTIGAFKISKKQYILLNSLKRFNLTNLLNLHIDTKDFRVLTETMDSYLSSHTDNFGKLKTKRIINDINI